MASIDIKSQIDRFIIQEIRGMIGLKAKCTLETDEERQLVWKLIDSADKYKWHDHRIDQEDLPKENGEYDIAYEYKDRIIRDYGMYSNKRGFNLPQEATLIAWREIEPFL